MSSMECTCGRLCGSEQALRDHRKHAAPYICGRCNKCLRTHEAFKQHKIHSFPACGQNPLRNNIWRCYDCCTKFDNQAALSTHLRSTGHAVEFHCCDCNKSFKTAKALNAHLKDKTHKTPAAKSWCKDCDRTFKDNTALQQHLQSVIHRPISNLTCLAAKICGVKCNAKFRSPSAMVAHMENGSCRSGMDRQKLNRLILAQDSDNLITSSSGIFEISGWASLENGEGSASCSGAMTPSTDSDEGAILTPGSSQIDLVSLVGRRLAGPASSDAESCCTDLPADGVYLCPLCPETTTRRFFGRIALEQHMESAAHTPKMFHCPSLLFPGESGKAKPSMQHFSTVSGLVAHIESGACSGGSAGLRKVMQYMEGRLEEMGISFKLLNI